MQFLLSNKFTIRLIFFFWRWLTTGWTSPTLSRYLHLFRLFRRYLSMVDIATLLAHLWRCLSMSCHYILTKTWMNLKSFWIKKTTFFAKQVCQNNFFQNIAEKIINHWNEYLYENGEFPKFPDDLTRLHKYVYVSQGWKKTFFLLKKNVSNVFYLFKTRFSQKFIRSK